MRLNPQSSQRVPQLSINGAGIEEVAEFCLEMQFDSLWKVDKPLETHTNQTAYESPHLKSIVISTLYYMDAKPGK